MFYDEDVKNKLLILFILDKYETPICQDILMQMCCVDNNWIPYFCFGHFVEELSHAGLISCQPDKMNADDSLLAISDDGKICLSMFYSSIFKSLRDDVSDYIRENKLKYRRKQEFVCNVEANEDGTSTLHCMVLNGQVVLFELKFVVPNEKKAESVAQKWQEAAPEVYKNYVDLLID